MVRMGKIVISVMATTGYNDEILSSPDRRYTVNDFYCNSKPGQALNRAGRSLVQVVVAILDSVKLKYSGIFKLSK